MNGGGHPPTGGESTAADTREGGSFLLRAVPEGRNDGRADRRRWQKNSGRRATVVHVNGSFHSDYAQGAAAATVNRMGGRRIAVVSLRPVDDIDTETPDADDLKLGDYVIYTVKPIIGADPASPPRHTPSRR